MRRRAPLAAVDRLTRAGAMTVGFTGLTLLVNVVSGVIGARALGAGGRGEVAAILALPQLLGFALAMGARPAIATHQARNPEDAPRLLAAWAAIMLPLAAAGVALAELLIPGVFAAQSHHAADLARLFAFTVVLALAGEVLLGMLLGDHDFLFVNVIRLAQPAAATVAYIVLWSVDALTVDSALVVLAATTVLATAAMTTRVLRRHGLGRRDRALSRTSLWFGVRAHGVDLAGLLNHRLDLIVLPAYVSARSLGLYAIAVSVSGIIITLIGTLANVLLPVAAREGGSGVRVVMRFLLAAMVLGLVLTLLCGVLARPLVSFVYGAEFGDSATSLRILLPASILLAGSTVLSSGLFALDRPFTASVPPILGVVVTAVGLFVFVPSHGIVAAALVSLASYAVVFAATLSLYRRACGLSWPQLAAATFGRSAVPVPGPVAE